jgi:hypothetical protein
MYTILRYATQVRQRINLIQSSMGRFARSMVV